MTKRCINPNFIRTAPASFFKGLHDFTCNSGFFYAGIQQMKSDFCFLIATEISNQTQ